MFIFKIFLNKQNFKQRKSAIIADIKSVVLARFFFFAEKFRLFVRNDWKIFGHFKINWAALTV